MPGLGYLTSSAHDAPQLSCIKYSHTVTVTGVPKNPVEPNALPYPRLDIRKLIADEKQLSLYVQAVHKMRVVPENENEVRSWFKISGIHGLPYESWDKAASPGTNIGYCEHMTTLFPTWHRPYMALYEQILHDHALRIANSYEVDKHLWQDAAFKLRAPYWDWASEAIPPPEVIELEHLEIIHQNVKKGPFPNPLLSYTFPSDFAPSITTKIPNTVRCPKLGEKVTNIESLKAASSAASHPAQQPIQAIKTALGSAIAHAPASGGGSMHIPPHTRRDWAIRIRSKLHQFGESYPILIFIGTPPAAGNEWRTSPNLVGAFAPFVNSSAEHCKEHADSIVEGFVPLNRYLCAGHVDALHPEAMVPFLKERIHWRIQKTDASIVEAKDVKELEVAVMSVEMEYVAEHRAYKAIARPSHHAEITNGKSGGRKL
ncbi:hypothetical protein FRB94_008584 [Tulasnella sp. JGI-2019a]|nr:hypothetical protein FRB94_008584 [Tulasnella sp. JGI-2019a]